MRRRPSAVRRRAHYLNGAVRIATTLSPQALLAVQKAIEREAGRRADGPHHGPRGLDIDLLLYGDATIDTRELVVPHPRLLERAFALDPLRELGVDPGTIPRRESPRVIRDPAEFAAHCDALRRGGCRLGLVPTMGALHAGHASLMRRARADCDRVAVTIFVNPLQFAPHEDLARYPRPFAADLALCAREGIELVFAPSVEAMYAKDFISRIAVGREAVGMEGAARPRPLQRSRDRRHDPLVARPSRLQLLGQKDAQSLAVLRRVHQDLRLCGAIVGCPIVREADGLAMSSRNVYLQPEDRRAAVVIVAALREARARGPWPGSATRGGVVARERLAAEPRCRAIDYVDCGRRTISHRCRRGRSAPRAS